MKRKMRISLLILLAVLFCFNTVQATSISNIQMEITLPENFINLTEEVQNNPSILEKYGTTKEQVLEDYQKNGIVLDAISQDGANSIVVMGLSNATTQKIYDLSSLKEKKREQFIEQYKRAKQNDFQTVQSVQTYVIENTIFLDTLLEQTTTSGEKTQIQEYYTIVNGNAVAISVKNKTLSQEEMKTIINSVKFSKIEVSGTTNYIPVIILGGIFVVLYLINKRREKKNKLEIQPTEKKTLISKAIKIYGLEQNVQFKGYLLFFYITLLLSSIFIGINTILFLTNGTLFSGAFTWEKTYNTMIVLQNIIQVAILLYMACILRKRKPENIKKIKRALLILLGTILFLGLVRMGMGFFVYHVSILNSSYYGIELGSMIRNALYAVVWYGYYTNAIRVSVYYQERNLQQILENPKTRWQTRKINEILTQTKIREYFEQHKAMDTTSGIAMNQIPKEYVNSPYFQELMIKKVIKTKLGKAYLNSKVVQNPNFEKRRQMRTALYMVGIYLLVMLFLQG